MLFVCLYYNSRDKNVCSLTSGLTQRNSLSKLQFLVLPRVRVYCRKDWVNLPRRVSSTLSFLLPFLVREENFFSGVRYVGLKQMYTERYPTTLWFPKTVSVHSL